jgi:hypothetical protein
MGVSFWWVDIRPQLVPRDAGEALDLEDAQDGDFLPLRDGLAGDAEAIGER